MVSLSEMLQAGASEEKKPWPEELREFYLARKNLTTQGPMVLYKERIVIPASLRQEVLDVLHSSHGGVSSMVARASRSVRWPGMEERIEARRAACTLTACSPSITFTKS